MTVVRPNSISGITSITAQTDTINFFKSDGSLAGLLLNGTNFNTTTGVSTFNVLKVGTATTLDSSGINITGVVTATSFRGDGSNLTGVAATSNIRTNAIVNSGVTTVSAGSSTIPSISPNGNASCGIYFPTTNTVAISTGGFEALRITGIGSVGIGVTFPLAKLHISGIASAGFDNPVLSLQNPNTSANARVYIDLLTNSENTQSTKDGAYIGAANNGVTGQAHLLFGTILDGSYAETVRLTTSGNLGVGLTNPTSKLQVTGDVSISGVGTATEFVSTSDITLKENITVIDNPLIKLSELRGVTFDWKKGGSSVGVIAQDVEKVLPQAVRGEENNKAVNYNGIIGLLVESIKQQQKEIDELKSRLDK